MKILHTADWHLGKRLERFERLPEQVQVLEEMAALAEAEAVDAVVIAGDLFDAFNPPHQATELFYRTLKRLAANGQRPVIAIAGNHDSPQGIEVPEPLARECGILFLGYPNTELRPLELPGGFALTRSAPGFLELSLPRHPGTPLRILATPYANEVRMKRAFASDAEIAEALREHWAALAEAHCDAEGVNMLVTHLYMVQREGELPEEPDGEKPIRIGNASAVFTDCIPPQVQYAALGHLHRYQNMPGGPCPVIYPSSPLAYSFAEAGQQKYVSLVELEPGEAARHRKIELASGFPLLRKRFEDIDLAVQWLEANPDCYVELTIATDTYIKSSDRQRLSAAHPRIIGPIPDLTGKLNEAEASGAGVDLSKNTRELFGEYFQHRFGQAPSDEILSLLNEILQKEVAQ